MTEETKNVDNDFEFARKTYYDLLVKGSEALEEMMEVARATEHPRAFEVLSGMMKNMADVNDKLMDLNKKNKDINQKDEPKQLGNTTNNLFVGTTTDLQRLIHNEKQVVIDAEPESE